VRTPKFFWRASSSRIALAGVIGLDACGDQPVRERLVAGDVPVRARPELGRLDLVGNGEILGRLAERVAGLEGSLVRLGDLRPLGELALEEGNGVLGRAVVEPRHQPQREHVLGALGLALRDALDLLRRLERHRRQRHGVDRVAVERAVLERVRVVARLGQVSLGERVLVDDQRRAARQVAEVRLQRRGVHCHEHVRRVARRQDVVVGEVDLEAGDARQRARGSPDLSGEIRKGREVVPEHGGLAGEAPAGQLHAVAGVAREADDDAVDLLDRLGLFGHRRRYSALSLIRSRRVTDKAQDPR